MLAEPTRVVNESDLMLPQVTRGRGQRKSPSFTDEELWSFVGDRGK